MSWAEHRNEESGFTVEHLAEDGMSGPREIEIERVVGLSSAKVFEGHGNLPLQGNEVQR